MKFVKVNDIKFEKMKFKNHEPLKVLGRSSCTVHNDTDSAYLCFNEVIERIKEEGIRFETEQQKRLIYSKIEDILQTLFNRVLEIRAEKSHTTNKIKFNRENIFTNMFCFAKKLYIGTVIDNEGELYPFEEIDLSKYSEEEKKKLPKHWIKHPEGPKHKIMGVPLKRSDMPEFCKEAAEKLAFDIAAGQGYEESKKFIIDTYKRFKETSIEEISGKKSIKDYNKYVPNPIEDYVKNGFNYQNIGGIFQSKVALSYNYIIAKHGLKYTPIVNGTKFNYVFVKPNNRNKIEAIGFIGKWPEEFNKMFEIDYEIMFRKSFIPVFESMFEIAKWIKPKEHIEIEEGGFDDFFE